MVARSLMYGNIISGFSSIARFRHTKKGKFMHVYAALMALLYAELNDDAALKRIFDRELRAALVGMKGKVSDWIYCYGADVVSREYVKSVASKLYKSSGVGKVFAAILDRKHNIFGAVRRWKLRRDILNMIDRKIREGTIDSLRVTGSLIMYAAVAYKEDEDMMRELDVRKKQVVDELARLVDKDVILFRLTGETKFLSDQAELRKPYTWFVWG